MRTHTLSSTYSLYLFLTHTMPYLSHSLSRSLTHTFLYLAHTHTHTRSPSAGTLAPNRLSASTLLRCRCCRHTRSRSIYTRRMALTATMRSMPPAASSWRRLASSARRSCRSALRILAPWRRATANALRWRLSSLNGAESEEHGGFNPASNSLLSITI